MLSRFLSRFLLPALLLLAAPQALPQTQFDLSSLAPGQVLLNLSATERTEVEQDTLNATVQYTTQGRDQGALQEEVNAAVGEALAVLEEESAGVEYSTGQYHVYIQQPRRPTDEDLENPVWRAQQSIVLESQDSARVLELVGRLQDAGLHVTNLQYSLSEDQHALATDELTRRALESLQLRADQAAHSLTKSEAALIEVSLESSGMPGPFYDRGVMAMAESARVDTPPSAEPGMTTVSVTVNAKALLSP